MRELYTAENMAEEKYHIADGTLLFEPSSVEVRVSPGNAADGRIRVSGATGARVTGYVTSSNLLMQCKMDRFQSNPGFIQWHVDADLLEAGAQIEGFFRVLCNHGEYKIPFQISVISVGMKEDSKSTEPSPQDKGALSTGATTRRLMEIAKKDWDGALRVFYSKQFEYSIRDEGERLIYRGLAKHPGSGQELEEFLMATGGKNPVTYSTSERTIRNELIGIMPGRSARGSVMSSYVLPIRAEGWGHIGLQVELSGAFLVPAEEFQSVKVSAGNGAYQYARRPAARGQQVVQVVQLTSRDFIGDTCQFSYQVDRRKLHAGRNFGCITLRSPYQEIRIPVEVEDLSGSDNTRRAFRIRREREVLRTEIEIMRSYEQYRIGKIKEDLWLRQIGELVQRLQSAEGRDGVIYRLYLAQLYLFEGRVHQAIMELEAVRRKLAGVAPGEVLEMSYAQYPRETDAAYCYRQYLTAIAYDDETMITPRVKKILHDRHRKTPSDWRIAVLLMHLSGETSMGTAAKWAFLKKLYRSGSRSPFLYLEAWEMIVEAPGRILTPEDARNGKIYGNAFEQSVLLYAMKHDMMTEEVLRACIQMADGARGFKGRLFTILAGAYEMDSVRTLQGKILQSICSMLVRSGVRDSSFWIWFSRGLERGLSVPGLAEFYMNSLPEDFSSKLPDEVLRKVNPDRLESNEARAYYYKELFENRGQYPALYAQNCKNIRNFIGKQIEGHHMSETLAVLYRACLNEEELSPANVGDLTKLSYICALRTTNMRVTKAVVLYAQDNKERSFAIQRGNCFLPIYGEMNQVFLEDDLKNRYAVGIPYTCDPVMQPVRDAGEVSAEEIADLPFAMEASGASISDTEITAQNVPYFEALVQSGELQASFRSKIRLQLIKYYCAKRDNAGDGPSGRDEKSKYNELLEKSLKNLDAHLLTAQERREVTGIMGTSGHGLLAIDWLRKCGSEGMDPKDMSFVAMSAEKELDRAEKSGSVRKEVLSSYRNRIGEIAYDAYQRGVRALALEMLLMENFDGFTYELEALYKDFAEEEKLVTPLQDFEVRILKQMLFTGAFSVRWENAIENMDKRGPKFRELAENTLAQYCYYAFSGQFELGDRVKTMILAADEKSEEIPEICALAYLKDVAKDAEKLSGEFPEKEGRTAKRFMQNLVAKGIYFPFYRDLEDITGVRICPNETLVEYRDEVGTGRGQGHIVIHYASGRKDRQESFAAKEMKKMYSGFYVSSFYLFCGEELHYFITDDVQETNIVESGTVGQDPRIVTDRSDRFHMLNQVALALESGDRTTSIKLLKDYSRADLLVKSLFAEEMRGDDLQQTTGL